MELIREFIEDYKNKISHFEHLAQTCAYQCERALKRRGLRALVTSRAKRLDSLDSKVESRAPEKNYQSIDEIYEDIIDLAGVRIALFFPGDREEVDQFIHTHFNVDNIKDFPEDLSHPGAYQKRFLGYVGRHYRLFLKPETLPPQDQHLSQYVIEVQVGSVLMHAWAEVEHDLVYKSTGGFLSHDEYAILDELNELMHEGEIALERLQTASKKRINTDHQPFSNHYELSSYLFDYVRKASFGKKAKHSIGRTDVLFQFLQNIGLDSAPAIRPILQSCDLKSPDQSLAQQIIDELLQRDVEFYKAYNQARLSVGSSDPFGAPHETICYFSETHHLGLFMQQWISSKKVLANLNLSLEPQTAEKLKSVKELRDQILYGDELPDEDEILSAVEFLQSLMDFLQHRENNPRFQEKEA